MTEEDEEGYFSRVVTDEIKARMIEMAYMTCPGIEKLDQDEVGTLLGGLLGYGVYLGLALARDDVLPPEQELSGFLVLNPEIIETVERSKTC